MCKKCFVSVMLAAVILFANTAIVNAQQGFAVSKGFNIGETIRGRGQDGRLEAFTDDENGVSLLWPSGWFGPYEAHENYLDVSTKLNEDTFIRIYVAPIDEAYPMLKDFIKATREAREAADVSNADGFARSDEMLQINGVEFVKWKLEGKGEKENAAYDTVYTTYANGHIYEVELCFMQGREPYKAMITDIEQSIRITADGNTGEDAAYGEHANKSGLALYSNEASKLSLLLPTDWSALDGYEKNGTTCEAVSPDENMWMGYYAGDTVEHFPTIEGYKEFVRGHYKSLLETEGIAGAVESTEEMIRLNGVDFVKWTINVKKEPEGYDGFKALVMVGCYADGKAFELVFECYDTKKMEAFRNMVANIEKSIELSGKDLR